MVYLPAREGFQGYSQRTQLVLERGGFKTAAFQLVPPSVLTSTLETPLTPAKATPPIDTVGPVTELSFGTRMIAVVLICPELVHPFCCQYPWYSPYIRVIRFTHFALNIP